MEEGHKITGNKKDGITFQKESRIIKFDIKVETPKGVLSCAYIRGPEANGEIAAELVDNQPKEIVNALPPAIKMNIKRAHAILGHSSKDTTYHTAAGLNMLITRGALKTCKSCAISKAK